MSKEKKHGFIKYAALTAGASAAAFISAAAFMYRLVLSRSGINSKIANGVMKSQAKEKEADDFRQGLENILLNGAEWFDRAEKEELSIPNSEGKMLHASLIRPQTESDIYVICIHGYSSAPRKMGIYAEKFVELGYNVLLPSLRGHAESEDEFVTMGWKDRLDVLDWINRLVELYPDCKIILHGVSMGAATTMMVTGEKLPENVRLAVEDCGYTTVWDIFSYKITNSMKLPKFPFLYTADRINRYKEDFSFKEASCVEQVKKSVTPTLFIHGEQDDFVPYEMLDEVFEAAACEKEKVSIPDAPHARSVCAHPEMYWRAVTDFIKKHI